MILDLKQTSGLELKLDTANGRIIFGQGLTAPLPAVRTMQEMQEVIMEPGINKPGELYYMYRDVHLLKDAPLLRENKLRYDVTAIKPDSLGRELMKTAGHYHPGSFGELYEVLEGAAFCLLQKRNCDDYRLIEDVILVEARAGEKIIIPPGYGHILVNPGPGYLVTSNWVSSIFSSEYELYKVARGAAYFLVKEAGSQKVEFMKNPFFRQLPPIRFAHPAKILDRFGLKEGSPIYPIITQGAEKLNFLNCPEKYAYSDIFELIKTGRLAVSL